jgi:hypothetical protein
MPRQQSFAQSKEASICSLVSPLYLQCYFGGTRDPTPKNKNCWATGKFGQRSNRLKTVLRTDLSVDLPKNLLSQKIWSVVSKTTTPFRPPDFILRCI